MTWTRWTATGTGRKRTDRWQDLLGQKMLEVTLQASEPADFRCTLSQMSIKGSRFIRFRSTPHSVTHRPIQNSHAGHLMVSTQLSGATRMRVGTNSILLRPGDVGLVDTAYPFTNEFIGKTERAIVLVDKSLLLKRQDCDVGKVSLADPYFGIIRQHVTTLANPDIEHNVELVRSLVLSLSYLLSRRGLSGTARARNAVTKPEIDSFIQLNVGSDLSAGRIAAEFGVSKRTLFGLYEAENQRIEQVIVASRLERAAHLLASDDCAAESIITISEMTGFKDVAHFCRRFRAAFGTTPSVWRKAKATDRRSPVNSSTLS